MSIIRINTKVWITQNQAAKEWKDTLNNIGNKIRRGTLESWYIEELNLTLVKRKNNTK